MEEASVRRSLYEALSMLISFSCHLLIYTLVSAVAKNNIMACSLECFVIYGNFGIKSIKS